jgi:hypothetical protein
MYKLIITVIYADMINAFAAAGKEYQIAGLQIVFINTDSAPVLSSRSPGKTNGKLFEHI